MELVVQCNLCKSIRQPIQQDVLEAVYGILGGVDYLGCGIYVTTCKCGAIGVYEQSGVLAVHTYGEHGAKPFRIMTRKELAEEAKGKTEG